MAMIKDAYATAEELRELKTKWIKRLIVVFIIGVGFGIWIGLRIAGG